MFELDSVRLSEREGEHDEDGVDLGAFCASLGWFLEVPTLLQCAISFVFNERSHVVAIESGDRVGDGRVGEDHHVGVLVLLGEDHHRVDRRSDKALLVRVRVAAGVDL